MRRYVAFALALLFYASVLPSSAEFYNYNAKNITGDNTGTLQGFKQIGSSAFTDNLTLYGNDVITKGPWVDVRAFMDGLSGRPTYATWNAAQGTTDVTAVIQAAIDNALQRKIKRVVFPDGVFKISGPIHTTYGEPGFRTITIEGAGILPEGDESYGFSGTMIDASGFSNAPAIVVQGGRDVTIRNMTIKGASYRYGLLSYGPNINAQTVSLDNISVATNWVTGINVSGLTQYAPYAGIAIDPYSGTQPGTHYPDVSYPSWTGTSTQYGKRYSSRTNIENVHIDGFFVGVVVQPGDSDGNGDYTRVINSSINNCAYGVSVGNSQSRNVNVTNTNFQYIHTIFSNNIFGKKIGKFDGPIKNCSSSQIFQVLSMSMAYMGQLSLENFYCEELVRLGDLGTSGSTNHSLSVMNSSFYYVGWANGSVTGYVYSVPFYNSSSPVNFISSAIIFSPPFAQLTDRATNGGPTSVNQSQLYTNSYASISDNASKIAYNYLLGGVANFAYNRWLMGSMWVPVLSGVYPGTQSNYHFTATVSVREQFHHYAKYMKYGLGGPRIPIQNTNNEYQVDLASVTSPAWDNTTMRLTFTYPNSIQNINAARLKSGTVIYHVNTNTLLVVDNVTANGGNWDVSTTRKTGYHIDSSGVKIPTSGSMTTGYIWLYPTDRRMTYRQWHGNILSGSDNVTSMVASDGNTTVGDDFVVGDLLWNGGDPFWNNYFPAGTTVLSTGTGWMQLNKNATSTNTSAPIELYR